MSQLIFSVNHKNSGPIVLVFDYMAKMLGVRGLDCAVCETYLATFKNDNQERERIAKEWEVKYHSHPTPAEINCLGCNSKIGPWYKHCRECAIRLCGLERKVKNCGQCPDYLCEKAQAFLDHVPAAKANCEAVYKKLVQDGTN